jgi:ribosomal RNA assembly protein
MQNTFHLDEDRIPVFIGKAGSKKRLLEKKFKCQIEIDSKSGEVTIENANSLNLFILNNIINAINLGQNPDNALKLEDETFVHDIIDIKNYVKEKNRLKTIMGRVIGKDGSTRKVIEEITKCNVAIKDHYVSIIGAYENTILVHEALDMLIKGAAHKTLYSYLERNKHNIENSLL